MNKDLENFSFITRPKSQNIIKAADYSYQNNRNYTNFKTKPVYYYQTPSIKSSIKNFDMKNANKLKTDTSQASSSYKTCRIIETQKDHCHTPEIKRSAFIPSHSKKISIR